MGTYMGTFNFKKIMIATDGSECSKQAVDKGIELARLSGGTVYAVYVASMTHISPLIGGYFSSINVYPYWKAIHESLKKQGQKALNYVKSLGETKGINVESVLLEGNPSVELIRYAEEEKIDIVVMGTLGNTGLNKLLLGSVASNLVRYSKVPVMVVKGRCES
jgi:nucleotide-binding universal stress UspA family protein